jgi:hypothetical protein
VREASTISDRDYSLRQVTSLPCLHLPSHRPEVSPHAINTHRDDVQSAEATEILERRLTPKNPALSASWQWSRPYGYSICAYGLTAQEIVTAVERLLQAEVLAIENEQEIFTAMVALKQGGADHSRTRSVRRMYSHVDV